jgi:2-C-methyl-D-erythritol 2,4-cyclodiphosphate synthase
MHRSSPAAGGRLRQVSGERWNLKVTEPGDLAGRRGDSWRADRSRVRVGQGFDVHPFVDDSDVRSCSAGWSSTVPGPCAGHSDADVIAHACADALLGAAGSRRHRRCSSLTPIPATSGANSIELLAEVARRVRAAGWEPGNVDASVVTDHPKLAPARVQMQERLSAAVGGSGLGQGPSTRRSRGVGARRGRGMLGGGGGDPPLTDPEGAGEA